VAAIVVTSGVEVATVDDEKLSGDEAGRRACHKDGDDVGARETISGAVSES
jgi:hypothetical protein